MQQVPPIAYLAIHSMAGCTTLQILADGYTTPYLERSLCTSDRQVNHERIECGESNSVPFIRCCCETRLHRLTSNGTTERRGVKIEGQNWQCSRRPEHSRLAELAPAPMERYEWSEIGFLAPHLAHERALARRPEAQPFPYAAPQRSSEQIL